MSYYQKHLFFCVNQRADGRNCCNNAGATAICAFTKQRLKALNLFGPGKIRASHSGCLGRCALGPSLVVYPDGIWYRYTSEQDIEEIIQSHLIKGIPVKHLLMQEASG
jgi:(2Fe-2S) ferredoxin